MAQRAEPRTRHKTTIGTRWAEPWQVIMETDRKSIDPGSRSHRPGTKKPGQTRLDVAEGGVARWWVGQEGVEGW